MQLVASVHADIPMQPVEVHAGEPLQQVHLGGPLQLVLLGHRGGAQQLGVVAVMEPCVGGQLHVRVV